MKRTRGSLILGLLLNLNKLMDKEV